MMIVLKSLISPLAHYSSATLPSQWGYLTVTQSTKREFDDFKGFTLIVVRTSSKVLIQRRIISLSKTDAAAEVKDTIAK
jgi:hypothetical protein